MKVLFAVSNEEISNAIVKKYQKIYKEIISYKNVYYFNAILKEIQKDKTYDRIVISEDLEAFTNTQYDQIDKFIFDKLDSISDEASNLKGEDIPIILICSDRRTKAEQMLVKIFGIGIYNAILENDRSIEEVCRLINKPRSKKEAKIYYKIDVDNVSYQSENENDVSEMEIQNIIAHYKRLGKNENQFVISFNNIASQYNDTQLKIICKFLPLNVRAVLEEKSPKYQQVMAFSEPVSKKIKQKEEKTSGLTSKLLTTKERTSISTKPVVIPSTVNINNVKRLTRENKQARDYEVPTVRPIQTQENNYEVPKINNVQESYEVPNTRPINSNEIEQTIVEPPKRGRGRPRKNPLPEQTAVDTTPKRRGRPRKNPLPEQTLKQNAENTPILPGFEDNVYSKPEFNSNKFEEEKVLPGFEEPSVLPGFEEPSALPEFEESSVLPGFEENIYNNPESKQLEENEVLPGFEESSVLPGFEENDYNIPQPKMFEEERTLPNFDDLNSFNNYNATQNISNNNNYQDISSLITPDKKVVAFVGTSKNGTSFIVNNLAEYASSLGIKTAILDTTKNRNSYYIYTRNEEELRKTAANSINGLIEGRINGIQENQNLTIYTALPNDYVDIENSGAILKTLVENYSLVLIDCDFDTPADYFRQVQEIYLVQSMDVLTIQPLTAFLRDLQVKNVLDQNKIRIVLNKYVNIHGINQKIIIGGMSCYNDPSMSFNTDLFDVDTVKYVTIPFEEEIYTKYLDSIINCNISLRGYSKSFMQVLKELQTMVYPIVVSPGKTTYQPPKPSYSKAFSSNMNNTLNQMKNRY